jgi:glycosyltransferase involved in cell wall biosynthesis
MDRSLPLLKIVGDGPDLPLVQQYSQEDPRIQALGKLPLEQVLELVGSARALIMPSLWNETFGRTTVESFSKGTPVIGSRIGGTAELIDEAQTGWLFQPGSASDLLAKLHLAVQQNEQQRQTMRKNARESFLNNFLPEHNYLGLMKCYKRAMELSGEVGNKRQSSPTT